MKKLTSIILLTLACFPLIAQYGISAGSLQYTRDYTSNNANLPECGASSSCHYNYNKKKSLSMPNPESFIVEDFMNYHVHDIDIPQNKDVALSIDYDNSLLDSNGEFIVQVGLATQPANLRSEKQNRLNVSLVVDVSGSMNGMKIVNAREALSRFVESMNEGDYLSIVTFNSSAKVVLPATRISNNKKGIQKKIKHIGVEGYTNLNAGMVLGYKEAMKNHSNRVNSRVILLTDGMTNRGETNLDRIIANSSQYNTKGIDISTIGVGQSLDFMLLRELADKGRGTNYFIGENEEDMYKVFNDELEAMMYNIGKRPTLKINLPSGCEVTKFYGYNPKYNRDNSISIDISNLGASSTRIFLMKVKSKTEGNGVISASLKYDKKGEIVSLEKSVKHKSDIDKTNDEIEKNFDIAFMAQNMKDAALACKQSNYSKSERILNNTKTWMQDSPYTEDEDFRRVYDILSQYVPEKEARSISARRYIME
ncbi:VWA domain-containing protein [Dysgonomonas sp. 520]|uniref:vWA domain-containing protein n=1 Tax=Dysgonomonas sp. 520 TaxID=2302931 RepID=UPI0013D412D1|nr:VWA domain-containing protein [Dysgonomonas sp. 520]NDW08409.1 VWA domain-containing protein [Dysgonomonas sp. 520]